MNLEQVLQIIKEQGTQFNNLPRDEEDFELYEQVAQIAIADYMLVNSIVIDDADWKGGYEICMKEQEQDEEDGSLDCILNGFVDLQIALLEPVPFEALKVPLELILMIKRLGKDFNYMMSSSQKIIYVDIDSTLIEKGTTEQDAFADGYKHIQPFAGSVKALEELFRYFDIYFVSTPSWDNPTACTNKVLWIKEHFPIVGYKNLILTFSKRLTAGSCLIDNTAKNENSVFDGVYISYGSEEFPDWKTIENYLLKEQIDPTARLHPSQ